MSDGLSRDLLNLANGGAGGESTGGSAPRQRAEPSDLERRLTEYFEQAPSHQHADIAAQFVNTVPKAMLVSLSADMRSQVGEVLANDQSWPSRDEAQARMRNLALGSGEFSNLDKIDLDLAYFDHLGPVGGQIAANQTASFINALPEFEAMYLQSDTSLRMLRALQIAKDVTPEITEARTTLHSSIDAGEAYYAGENAYRQQLSDTLARDPTVQKALMEWPQMDEQARIDTLQHVVNIQAEVGGFDPVPIETKDWPVIVTRDGEKRTRRGSYSPDNSVIRINKGVPEFWEDPVKVIGTTVHENTHSRQHQLGAAFELGNIEPDDPKYVAAGIFADGLVHGYVSSSIDHTKYRDQLVEQQARSIQGTIVKRLDSLGIKAAQEMDAEILAFLAEWSGDDNDDIVLDFEAIPQEKPRGP